MIQRRNGTLNEFVQNVQVIITLEYERLKLASFCQFLFPHNISLYVTLQLLANIISEYVKASSSYCLLRSVCELNALDQAQYLSWIF